jgi:predicted ATPase/DNA-binding CsgD family transcriptional regulator
MSNLPPFSTPFIGRQEELAEIARLLDDPACRLLTLVGPGGIGKTRLAIEAAWTMMDGNDVGAIRESPLQTPFPDGVYFVPLQPLSSPDLIPSAIADAVGFQYDPKQLLDYCREKAIFLILDNFEHLLDGVEIVSTILMHAPGIKILTTSRETLNLQEEWLYHVKGMEFPEGEPVDEVENYGAVQLFAQSARRARADFSLEVEREAVVRICQLVEGLPLALEMTAAWLKRLPCQEIAGELARGLDILETPARNVPPRHRSMRAVFEHSWNLLSDSEREVFKKLSVFRGGFRKEAAQAIAGASLGVLSALVDKSLLRVDASGRYDLHELLRQYAEEKLTASPLETERVQDLHCAYYADFLHRGWAAVNGVKQKETLEEIETEIGNIRAGWAWAVRRQSETEIGKALDSLWFFYDTRGLFQEGEQAFHVAVEALRPQEPDETPSVVVGKLIARYGMLRFTRVLPQSARSLLEESVAILRQHDARGEIAHALFRLGEVAMFLESNYPLAQQYLQESLALYQEIGDLQGSAFTLGWLGFVLYYMGDFVEARRLAQEGLALSETLESRLEKASVLIVLSSVAVELGEYPEAKQLGLECFKIAKEVGIYYAANAIQIVLGAATCALGEYPESQHYLYEALKMSHQTSFTPYILCVLAEIANLFAELGEKERALALLSLSLHHPAHYGMGRHTSTRLLAKLEAELPPDTFAEALERGKTLDLDTVVKALLVELKPAAEPAAASPMLAAPQLLLDPLTQREVEVLHLITAGLTNRQIAEQLFLSPGTVKWYVNQIFGKLSVTSRTQAIARATELKLLP